LPPQGPGLKKNYQIHLKSSSGPINVLLVNKDADSDKPVVVQVPPPAPGAADSQNQNQNPAGATAAAEGRGARSKVRKLAKIGFSQKLCWFQPEVVLV
jgi:transcription factor E2F4/5